MKQTFGLEFEFMSSLTRPEIASRLVRAFRTFKGKNDILYEKHKVDTKVFEYHQHSPDKWGVEYDSSIETTKKHQERIELITPPLRQNDFPVIEKALSIVSPFSSVNGSCGLHCHVGVSSQELVTKMAILWYISELEIMKVFPLTRHNNSYCIKLTNSLPEAFNPATANRYNILNIAPWTHKRTVEFRGHSGTLNYKKVKKWVLFCLSFMRLANKLTTKELEEYLHGPFKHITFDIFNFLDISNTKTHRYYIYRMQHFEKAKKRRLNKQVNQQNILARRR